MNNPPSVSSGRRAFTLIELLAVIAIIAILAALLFPGIKIATITADKLRAKEVETAVIAALSSYQSEYGKFPSVDPDGSMVEKEAEDTIVGDRSLVPNANIHFDNSAIFNTLRAIDAAPNLGNRTNPKRISYFESPAVRNPSLPKNGFLDTPESAGSLSAKKGCLFDPWGNQYFVVLDTNYDNQINVSMVYSDFTFPDSAPRCSAGVFSLGVDRQVGSPTLPPNTFQSGQEVADDVLSWH